MEEETEEKAAEDEGPVMDMDEEEEEESDEEQRPVTHTRKGDTINLASNSSTSSSDISRSDSSKRDILAVRTETRDEHVQGL